MPNWVYNGLTIEGSPEQVNKLIEQMNRPFTRVLDSYNMETKQYEKKLVTYPNPVFAFHNIYNHIQDNVSIEDYDKQPLRSEKDMSDPDWWNDTQRLSDIDNSWYNWNVRNWGTKWDVAVHSENEYPDTYMETSPNGENQVVYYNFNTAWSPPMPAISKLSEQYPSLLFTLSFEEEQGWGGECEFLRGEMISLAEYENKCRDCDAYDTLDYCESDCGEICSKCNWLGEADLDKVAECQTHMQYLDDNHVPAYRLVNNDN